MSAIELRRVDPACDMRRFYRLDIQPVFSGDAEGLGFDLAHVHEATTHEVIYQAVMRTSLRCPDVTNPVTIVVPDSHAAYRLQGSHRSHQCHETRQYRKAQAKALNGDGTQ